MWLNDFYSLLAHMYMLSNKLWWIHLEMKVFNYLVSAEYHFFTLHVGDN